MYTLHSLSNFDIFNFYSLYRWNAPDLCNFWKWMKWLNEWMAGGIPSLSSFWHPHTIPSSLLLSSKCQMMSCKGSEFTIGRWHGPPKMSSDGPYHLLGKIVKYVVLGDSMVEWTRTYESWHPDTRHKHVNLAFKNADWLLMLLQ